MSDARTHTQGERRLTVAEADAAFAKYWEPEAEDGHDAVGSAPPRDDPPMQDPRSANGE